MAAREDGPRPPYRTPCVLVVDDELTPRSIVCRMVRGMGYPVRAARDGRDALRYLRQHPGEVRLLIADLVMPLMDGGELGERARELEPRIHLALMSGDPVGHDAELLAGYPEFRVLQKPVGFGRLHDLLVEVLGPVVPDRWRPAFAQSASLRERRKAPRDD